MKAFASGVGVIADLEVRQRVRSVAFYVLLGVVAVLMLAVTVLLLVIRASTPGARESGSLVFSIVVYFALLLGTLVTPALSGGSVNGDRESGTLATTQITQVTTAQIIVGKFLAAWASALAFLVVAIPFLIAAAIADGPPPGTVFVSLGVTAVELGVVAAIGVGLSSVIGRTIFSVVVTYLVVAALSVGTLLAFGLIGLVDQVKVTSTSENYASSAYDTNGDVVKPVCDAPDVETYNQPRWDHVWWLLAANPYVALADATPTQWTKDGGAVDAFGGIKYAVRAVQIAPETHPYYSDCHPGRNTDDSATPEQVVAKTVPSWSAGLAIEVLLGAVFLLFGGRALRTPTKRLPRGSRIA